MSLPPQPTTSPPPSGSQSRPRPLSARATRSATKTTKTDHPAAADVPAHPSVADNHLAVDAGDSDGAHCSTGEHDRDRRVARAAAFNNRAVLLIAAGRGDEACRLLRACLQLLPEEPRPAFNLALALWRLGRPRAACAHWMTARGWLWSANALNEDGDRISSGGGAAAGGRCGDVHSFTRLLESARRRKVRNGGSRGGEGRCGFYVFSHRMVAGMFSLITLAGRNEGNSVVFSFFVLPCNIPLVYSVYLCILYV